jgi:hypothetical protein
MRAILALSILFNVGSTGASSARDYPWCARTITNEEFGDCSFTSYRQCMATVSGQGGECVANPRTANGRLGGGYNARWPKNENGQLR